MYGGNSKCGENVYASSKKGTKFFPLRRPAFLNMPIFKLQLILSNYHISVLMSIFSDSSTDIEAIRLNDTLFWASHSTK